MDIVRVRYFLAVCEHGSFTAAAKACGVSQPSVTTGVARLERAMGGKLFQRYHPVRLTSLGAELRPLLQELQSVADRVAAAVKGNAAANAKAGLLGRGARASGVPVHHAQEDVPVQDGRADDLEFLPDENDQPDFSYSTGRWLDLQKRSNDAIARAEKASKSFEAILRKDNEAVLRVIDEEVSE